VNVDVTDTIPYATKHWTVTFT